MARGACVGMGAALLIPVIKGMLPGAGEAPPAIEQPV
jgi:hypothetical protein